MAVDAVHRPGRGRPRSRGAEATAGSRDRGPIDQRGRGKAKGPADVTREAVGCFCMLILGAILTLGGIVIILPALIEALVGNPPAGLWRSTCIWLVAPAIGIAVVGWLTYGFRRQGLPPRLR